jgi:hypothetical protein
MCLWKIDVCYYGGCVPHAKIVCLWTIVVSATMLVMYHLQRLCVSGQ